MTNRIPGFKLDPLADVQVLTPMRRSLLSEKFKQVIRPRSIRQALAGTRLHFGS